MNNPKIETMARLLGADYICRYHAHEPGTGRRQRITALVMLPDGPESLEARKMLDQLVGTGLVEIVPHSAIGGQA